MENFIGIFTPHNYVLIVWFFDSLLPIFNETLNKCVVTRIDRIFVSRLGADLRQIKNSQMKNFFFLF